jgi:hypothetical protein
MTEPVSSDRGAKRPSWLQILGLLFAGLLLAPTLCAVALQSRWSDSAIMQVAILMLIVSIGCTVRGGYLFVRRIVLWFRQSG